MRPAWDRTSRSHDAPSDCREDSHHFRGCLVETSDVTLLRPTSCGVSPRSVRRWFVGILPLDLVPAREPTTKCGGRLRASRPRTTPASKSSGKAAVSRGSGGAPSSDRFSHASWKTCRAESAALERARVGGVPAAAGDSRSSARGAAKARAIHPLAESTSTGAANSCVDLAQSASARRSRSPRRDR